MRRVFMELQALKDVARQVRRDVITMTNKAGAGHPGGSFSCTEALVALYFDVMNIDPKDDKNPSRDRFVLSKGHAAPALYGVLCERGYFGREEFDSFRQLHGILQGHPDAKKCPGVDASTGSLGQGISIAAGMALGAKLSGNPCHVYTIIGDGESQEGLVWEASMAAAHYKLDNFTVIFDHNGLQIDGSNDEVMSLGDIGAKWRAFGYDVIEVEDGNDMQQVLDALHAPACPGKPRLIHLHTTKGKGVSFMEGQVGWHGKAPNAEEAARALKELED
ncbi:MAG: transketolase [Clostridiales bacterium]|nr:transketolase [Clostridiales bacterium]